MSYSLVLAAPQFNKEQEKIEQASLSVEEIKEADDDLYGRPRRVLNCVDIAGGKVFDEFHEALELIPVEEKTNYLEALDRGCELTSEVRHIEHFLICESFNAPAAARRLVSYWEYRVFLFGRERAFHPLSIATSFFTEDEENNFTMRFLQVLDKPDDAGRMVLLIDPNKKTSDFSRESTLRVLWCMIHDKLRISETPSNQDVVILGWARRATVDKYDRKFQVRVFHSLNQLLPIRVVSYHHWNATKMFQFTRPVVLHVLGRKTRQRTVFHNGSEKEVLEELEGYGIRRDILPSDIGGSAPDENENVGKTTLSKVTCCRQSGNQRNRASFLPGSTAALK